MLNLSDEKFSKKEYVAILFKEYDSLRAEIVSRSSSHQKLLAITATLIAALLGLSNIAPVTGRLSPIMIGLAVLLLLAAALLSTKMVFKNTKRIGRHVAKLEERINALAGEDLLGWEKSFAER